MAHILVIELPGGNDPDIVQAAFEAGHEVSFLSADLSHYRRQHAIWPWLSTRCHCLEVPDLDEETTRRAVADLHARRPVEALVCLVDTRIVLAAELAAQLGLRFLSPDTARLLRHKYRVRLHLSARGLRQPPHALATDADSLQRAVDQIGLPLIIKPVDGSGSTDIVCLEHPEDLAPWMSPVPELMPYRADYGLGCASVGELLVERRLPGQIIGMDIFSADGQHRLLGIHSKRYFPAPSFAIEGGTFTPWHPDMQSLAEQAFATLDALDFDFGASHSEWVLNDEGLHLIEINPRLVGARMPALVSLARQRRLTQDLLDLHLGRTSLDDIAHVTQPLIAVSHWLAAPHAGQLVALQGQAPLPHRFIATHQPGDLVRPPMENADRLGCLMVSAPHAAQARALASQLAQQALIQVQPL